MGLRPEAALYLRLAGAPPGDAELCRLMDRPVAWDEVRALARRDRVVGAVWRRLQRAGARLPDVEAEAFRREAAVADFHMARLQALLAEVLRLLEGAGLRPVLLKGAALALSAYPRWQDRPMGDLDLLLPPDEATEAFRLLAGAGWRPASGAADAYASHHHLPPLRPPGGGAEVELHRALLPAGHPFVAEEATLRRRVRRLATPLGSVLMPDPADLLVHAAIHFAWAHELRWGGWRAIADAAALVARTDEWAARAGPVPGPRGAAALYWTLRLAEAVGGVPVPAAALARLRPPLPRRLERLLLRHFAHQLVPGPGNAPSVALARVAWLAALQPGRGPAGRPWRIGVAGARAAAGVGGAVPRPLGARLQGQAGRLGAWGRYWRAVMG